MAADQNEFNIIYNGQISLRLKLALTKINRFMDNDPAQQTYPKEIFGGADSVFQHVFNSVGIGLAQVQPPEDINFSLDTLSQTLASHDTPELITGDNPVLLNHTGTVIVNFDQAQEIMTEVEYQQFLNFEQAHNWLSSSQMHREMLEPPQAESVVANIIDLVQGNFTYFEIISHYRAEHPNQKMTPQIEQLLVRGANYYQNKQAIYLEAMQQLPASPEYDYTCQISQQLLAQQEEFIPLSIMEIQANSNDLGWLRFSILSLMSSFFTQSSIDKVTATGEHELALENLLVSYSAQAKAGEIQSDIIESVYKTQKRALKKGITLEQIEAQIRLGLLQSQRELLFKPEALKELADPQIRARFAKELLLRV